MDASTDRSPSLYESRREGRSILLRLLLDSGTWVFAVVFAMFVAAFGGMLVMPQIARAQVRDSYEGLEVSWKLADHDCAPRILQHERSFQQAHTGQSSEYLRFHAGTGTYVHFVSPLPPSRIIDELAISVWIKANRPGLQLSARVVLPRSTDPRTGAKLTTLLRGETYREAEKWQKLTIGLPAKLLNQQVPILRSQFGSDVSPREAYVDMLVLNVYGGAGTTELWLDDLEVQGQVPVDNVQVGSLASGNQGNDTALSPQLPNSIGTSKAPPVISLKGSVLTVAGRPLLVRAIDGNGEPFAWLKARGFNAVRLPTPATAEQLREAEECGMWLIVPPPTNQSPVEYGSALKRILAWDLGSQLGAEQVESTRRLAQQLQSVPKEDRGIMICLPREETWQYSRIADLLVLEPPGPNSSLPLRSYGQWYLQRLRLARMGSHFWASIRTELSPAIARQQTLMGAPNVEPLSLEPEQIRLQVYHAIASGARGLLFRSSSRLDGTDRLTDLRVKTLQRVNQELRIVEPWAATGEHESELETGDSSVRVSVLKTDRSRLLLVIRQMENQQYVVGPIDEHSVSFEVPNVPDTDEVYQVGEDGLRRITQQRSVGLRIALQQPRLITTIVLTQDRLVINFLARQTAALRKMQAELVGEIAAQMYAAVVETHQQLIEMAPLPGLTDGTVESPSLAQARAELQQFQQLVETGGHERAYEFLQRGRQRLAQTRYENWMLATKVFPSPVSSPLCVSFFSLPYHYALGRRLQGIAWGPNSLAGGDFENLSLLQSSGWKNLTGNMPDLRTGVELSLQTPHSGRTALRLQCWPTSSDQAPLVVESPPIRITSAPVPVRRGQIVRIHGWARVPQPIVGSMDGLLIYDSIVGLDLAQRIKSSEDWREFTFYRAGTRDGTFTVTAALGGIGQAWLDDVTVNLIDVPRPHAQAPAKPDALPRR